MIAARTLGACLVLAAGAAQAETLSDAQAGGLACAWLAKTLHGKGRVVILNGPQTDAVVDRVQGCKDALSLHPGMLLMSSDESAAGSSDGGEAAARALLARLPHLDGVFVADDAAVIGFCRAARALNRSDLRVATAGGLPDDAAALQNGGCCPPC